MWTPSLVYATTWALDLKNNPGHNMKHAYVSIDSEIDLDGKS